MKKIILLFGIICLLNISSFGQTITLNPVSGEYCSGVAVGVSYSVDGSFGVGNKFSLELSDSNGGFGSPIVIGIGESYNSLGGTFPKVITESTNYRLRVVSSNPIVISNDNGNNIRLKQTPILTLTPSIPCQGDDVTLAVSQVSSNNLILQKSDYYTGANSSIVPFNGTSKFIKHQDIYGNEGFYILSSSLTGCTSEQVGLLPMPCHPQVGFVVRDKNSNSTSTSVFPLPMQAFSSTITDMVLDETDNIYVRGYFTDSLVIGQDTITSMFGTEPELLTAFIAKFDKLGNKIWLKKYRDFFNPSNQGSSLAYENGNIYITGFFQNKQVFNTANSSYYNLFKIQNEEGTDIFTKSNICVYNNLSLNKDEYLWLAKFDSNGNFIFHKQINKPTSCPANIEDFRRTNFFGVTTNIRIKNNKLWLTLSNIILSFSSDHLTLDNDFVVNNFSDIVLVKLNKDNGNILKTELISSQNLPNATPKQVNFEIDSQDNLIVCSANGYSNNYASSMTFGTTTINFTQLELFVAKYNETSGWAWIRQSNNYTNDNVVIHQLSIDHQDNILLQVKLRSNVVFSLAGISSQSLTYDYPDFTLGIFKMSSAGQGLWLNTLQGVSTYSTGNYTRGKTIAFDSNNNIFVMSYARLTGNGDFNKKHSSNDDRYFDWAGGIGGNGLYFTVFKPTGELKGAFSNMKYPATNNGGDFFEHLSLGINSQNKMVISGSFIRDILIGNQLYSNRYSNVNGADYTQQFFITSLSNPQSIVLKDVVTPPLPFCGNEQIQVSFEPFGTFLPNTRYKVQLGKGNTFYSYGESTQSPITITVPDSILSFSSLNTFYIRVVTTDDKVIGTHNLTKYIQAKKNPTVSILSNTNQNSVCLSSVSYQSLYGYILNDGINPNTHQWKRNGINVGTNNFQYFPTTVAETGEYTLTVTNNGCTTTSAPYFFSIVEPASATVSGNFSIYQGQNSSLPLSLTGGFPYTITLSDGQQKTLNTNSGSFSVSPVSTTTYSLSSVSNACGNGSVSGSALVTLLQCNSGLTLLSPNDDVSSGVFERRAATSNGLITATNKIIGVGTKSTYSSKVIVLNPGFKADSGTVFSALTGGCN